SLFTPAGTHGAPAENPLVELHSARSVKTIRYSLVGTIGIVGTLCSEIMIEIPSPLSTMRILPSAALPLIGVRIDSTPCAKALGGSSLGDGEPHAASSAATSTTEPRWTRERAGGAVSAVPCITPRTSGVSSGSTCKFSFER